MTTEIAVQLAQRETLKAFFERQPFVILTHAQLVAEVGENFRSRLPWVRRHIDGVIDLVPVFLADGTRGYGSYVYRPQALGRDAATPIPEPWESGTLFDLHPGPYQYQTRVTHG